MKRNHFISALKALGYIVTTETLNQPIRAIAKPNQQRIHIQLSKNDYLKVITVDDSKPYTFETHDLFDLMHHTKQKPLYDLVVQYAGTALIDRN